MDKRPVQSGAQNVFRDFIDEHLPGIHLLVEKYHHLTLATRISAKVMGPHEPVHRD